MIAPGVAPTGPRETGRDGSGVGSSGRGPFGTTQRSSGARSAGAVLRPARRQRSAFRLPSSPLGVLSPTFPSVRRLSAPAGASQRESGKAGHGEVDVPLPFEGVTFRPGDVLHADEDGVVGRHGSPSGVGMTGPASRLVRSLVARRISGPGSPEGPRVRMSEPFVLFCRSSCSAVLRMIHRGCP
ncbi:hypothetical protein AB0D27_44420 [Streptomyces sp. NPDC048415]|uniref:RraA family protein n=1 Tax=Streptomyces sp. NPDC048415 TaxID=3154822 RepID=UPI00343A74D9